MEQLYKQTFGTEPKEIKKLSGAGSNRQYYRIYEADGSSVIGVDGDNTAENRTFLALARHMHDKGIRVPRVLAVADDYGQYLQEDLGDTTLYDLIERDRKSGTLWSEELVALLHQTMRDLPTIQFRTAEGFDFSNCFSVQEFLPVNIRWDLNYFKYCFLKLTGVAFDEFKLEKEFEHLEHNLLAIYHNDSSTSGSFLYRDFQSRNVMVHDGKPYYIDFQGGYRGPYYYDVASFLWQSRAAYPDELRESLIDTYINALQPFHPIDAETFRRNLEHFVFFRQLQVLGAYGFRGLHEHKTMFITPIAQTLKQLTGFSQYPYIQSLVHEIARLPQFHPHPAKGQLVVRVTSFSFKKGIPEDYSGNGGGFVFDCRAPHNPGRYDEYKQLTGLDQPVIDFLEHNSTMPDFIQHVYGLVDPAVETYLNRGFTSLMVNFGCTGGRHRSVYCAQHLADHLAAKYPAAKIILTHREQGISREYN